MVTQKRVSLFWPVVLIGTGAILLLRNLGYLPEFNWSVLLKLWPLVLVVIGLDLLFGHRAPWVGGLIGLLTVAAAIAFLYYSPALGISTPEGIKTEVVSSPLEDTSSVEYYLDTSYPPVTISALPGSTDLVKATIVHRGQVNFDVKGEADKIVSLSATTEPDAWLSFDLGLGGQKWDIGLNPRVPTTINLNGGSGSLDLDLTGITLEALRADLGSGASKMALPQSKQPYEVDIESGSGAVNLVLAEGTDVTLELNSASGAVSVSIPSTSGVRIEIMDDGSGSLQIPNSFIAGAGNADNGEMGTWQSVNFDSAANTITIRVSDRGSGSIHFKIR